MILSLGLVGTTADLIWTQFGRSYHLVTYRSVIGMIDSKDDQIQQVVVDVIEGFRQPEDGRRFSARLARDLKNRGVDTDFTRTAMPISTRARLSRLCDRETVMCLFHNQLDPPIQGEPQGPSRLGLRAERSENLTDSNGRHR